ncbi:MAG TPA: T9SS type A sorting domain-containing protein [Bacteroidales bacterium]|nr:T9SS type A sorting domain-containing protein [Bacteroidales bacterium]HPT11005.1 T9SS type A sorting domain-containing protein [Bacteroidales bacterium]
MNKNLILPFLFLSLVSLSAAAQMEKCQRPDDSEKCKCDIRVQKLDSLVNYILNPVDSSFTPAYVIKYTVDDNGKQLNAERINLPLRTQAYYQIYSYNTSGNLETYLYQEWKNEQWADVSRTDSYFDEDNNLTQEIFNRKDANNAWEAYQQHFYSYEEGRKSSYLRKVKDANGVWNDISHHYYVYDSVGNLSVLYGQYISSGLVFWKTSYFYSENGRLSYRIFQQLKYVPELKSVLLVNVNYQTYVYDIYGDVHELLTREWINNEWKFTNKHIYYYSLIPGKKVVLCHKGHEICVSTSAVKAHLDHGDVLGKCPGSSDNSICCRCNENPRPPVHGCKPPDKGYIIYPIPFKSEIKIRFTTEDNSYNTVSLCTISGKLVTSQRITGQTEVTLSIPKLPDGPYLLRLTGKNGISVTTVIKR